MKRCPYSDINILLLPVVWDLSLGLGTQGCPRAAGFVISEHKFAGGGRDFMGGGARWSVEVLISDTRLRSIVRDLECNQEGALSLLRVPKFSWHRRPYRTLGINVHIICRKTPSSWLLVLLTSLF